MKSIKKRPYFLIGLAVISIFVACLSGAFFFFYAHDWEAQRKLRLRLAQLENKNLPFDNESVQRYVESLTSDTRSFAWTSLLSKVAETKWEDPTSDILLPEETEFPHYPRPGEAWPDPEIITTFTDDWKSTTDEAILLAKQEFIGDSPPTQLALQFESHRTLLVQQSGLTKLARIIFTDALISRSDGDFDHVYESVIALLGCARILENEPLIVSQALGNRAYNLAFELINTQLDDGKWGVVQCKTVIDILRQRTSIGPFWKRCLHGELALQLPNILDRERYNPSVDVPTFVESGYPYSPAKDALALLDQYQLVLNLDTSDLASFEQGLRQTSLVFSGRFDSGYYESEGAIVCAEIFPAFSTYGSFLVQRAVLHRQAIIALEIRKYMLEQNRVPPALEELENARIAALCSDLPNKSFFRFDTSEEGAVLTFQTARTSENAETSDDWTEIAPRYYKKLSTWTWNVRR